MRLPPGLRDSVHNFFDNAAYPGTVLNQLLQGKLEPAMQGSARFVFNTTLGIGGLFDVATGLGFEREEEDFGQTLAVWGMEEGNYIHWPVLEPSSVRDTPGLVAGALTDVLTYVAVPPLALLLELVDMRANLDSAGRVREESALDPYVFTRETYRQRRAFLIHDGNPPPHDPGEDATDGRPIDAATGRDEAGVRPGAADCRPSPIDVSPRTPLRHHNERTIVERG